ncbi:hypothetical protein [Chryseobacterium viscerum]|uniref:hypothetical protein n=1 Tax=Chryseobacterium viscerum TaxID=1037377 RepID=UPI000F51344C|nr:hypothetical protein [Chryseobacterium viscerum]
MTGAITAAGAEELTGKISASCFQGAVIGRAVATLNKGINQLFNHPMENKKLELKKADIQKLIEALLSELEKLNDSTSFAFDNDLYWNITNEELYDPYKDPKELTMGSLIEDWEFLQKVLDGKREIIDYDLYKIASLLRFLGKSMIITKAQNIGDS